MNFLMIIFGLLFVAGLIGGVGWLVFSYSNENRQITWTPKKVAEQIAEMYRDDRLDEIEGMLEDKTSSWDEKDWEKFHKERNKQIGSVKDNQSQISAELETLKELKTTDKRIEEVKRELNDKPSAEEDEWNRKFNNDDKDL